MTQPGVVSHEEWLEARSRVPGLLESRTRKGRSDDFRAWREDEHPDA